GRPPDRRLRRHSRRRGVGVARRRGQGEPSGARLPAEAGLVECLARDGRDILRWAGTGGSGFRSGSVGRAMSGPVAPVKILLVDDRAENLVALRGILRDPGYDILTAS